MQMRPSSEAKLSRSRQPVLALALVLAAASATPPAHAEFYKLTGRYECLADAAAVCYDATPAGPGPFAASAAAAPPSAAPEHAAAAPTAVAPPPEPSPTKAPAAKKAAQPPSPGDPLEGIAARLQARSPAAGDLKALRIRAKAGDSRALEMLAWCELMGVGTAPDPVHAYFLYGEAAKAGAGDGTANQAIVFKRDLTQDQRQQVLAVENGRMAAAPVQ